ncbi:transcription factor SPT20 homolog isoform X2 [Anneissia japonica]|nr:transcription factor SPT20 homolog isoform X2 [Anneissia japonica]
MSIDITLHDNNKTNVNVTISQQQDSVPSIGENPGMTYSPVTKNENTCFVSDFIDGRIEFTDIENEIRDPTQYKEIEKKLKELEEELQKELIESYGIKSIDCKTNENHENLINSTNSPGMSIGQVDGQISNAISRGSPAAPPQNNNGAGGTYDMKGPPNTVATDVKTPTSEALPNIAELRPNQPANQDILRQPIKAENQQFMNTISCNTQKNPSLYKNPTLKREPMSVGHNQQNFQNPLPSMSHAKMGFTSNMIKSEPLQNQQVQSMNGMFTQQQPNVPIPGQAAPKQVFNGPGGRVFEDPKKIAQYSEYQTDRRMPVNIDRTPNVTVPVGGAAPNMLASQQQTQKKPNLAAFKQTNMPITQHMLRQPHQQPQQQYINKLQQLPNGTSLMMPRQQSKAQQMRLLMYKQIQLQQQQQQQQQPQQQQNPQLMQTQNMQDQMKQVLNGRPPPRYEEARPMNNVVYQNNQPMAIQQAQMVRQNTIPNSLNPPDYRQSNAIPGMTGMPNQAMPVQHVQAGQTMQTMTNQQNTMYNFQDQNARGFQQQQHGQSVAMMRLAAGQNAQLRPGMSRQNLLQNANMLRGQMLQQQQRVWPAVRNQSMNPTMAQNMLQATAQASTAVPNPRYRNAYNIQGVESNMQYQPGNQNFAQVAAPAMNSNNVANVNMQQRYFSGMMNRQQQLNTNVQTTISMGAHQAPALEQQLQVSTSVTAYAHPNAAANTADMHQSVMNNVPLGNQNPSLHSAKQYLDADLNDLEAILSNPM